MSEPLEQEVLDPRHAARVLLRLPVELRHHRAAWRTETEDVGPRGCQLVSPRVLPLGSDVSLSIECRALGRTVAAQGRIAWARAETPARLGVLFDVGPADRSWFQELLRADPVAARALRTPLRLVPGTPLHLGAPPAAVLDFTEDELSILRAIGGGTTVDALAAKLGRRFPRARGALFSLLSRRLAVFQPGPAGATERWRPILFPATAARDPLAPPPRPPAAQRLYEEGIAHLGAGRVDLAIARFREALALVPDDSSIAATVARLERWR